MPYYRKPRGVGQASATGSSAFMQVVNPLSDLSGSYNAAGQYQGGNFIMDAYCSSFLGASDPTCGVATPAQIRAAQAAELATTSATPAQQAAALAAGDAAIAADMAANPGDYIAQCVASMYPELSATLGPTITANLFGIQPDCSYNFFSSWLAWGGIALFALIAFGGRR